MPAAFRGGVHAPPAPRLTAQANGLVPVSEARTKLRVGVVLPSAQVPAWQASLLQSLIEWEDADVVLWTLGGSNDGPAQANPIYRAFRRVEDRLPHDVPDALAPHPVMALVDGICGLAGPGRARAPGFDVMLVLFGPGRLSMVGLFVRI